MSSCSCQSEEIKVVFLTTSLLCCSNYLVRFVTICYVLLRAAEQRCTKLYNYSLLRFLGGPIHQNVHSLSGSQFDQHAVTENQVTFVNCTKVRASVRKVMLDIWRGIVNWLVGCVHKLWLLHIWWTLNFWEEFLHGKPSVCLGLESVVA